LERVTFQTVRAAIAAKTTIVPRDVNTRRRSDDFAAIRDGWGMAELPRWGRIQNKQKSPL
jgi:hypothetical protein